MNPFLQLIGKGETWLCVGAFLLVAFGTRDATTVIGGFMLVTAVFKYIFDRIQ